MTELLEGQIELDGYLFGRRDDPVKLLRAGDVTDAVQVANQDVQHPSGDSFLMGRDRLVPPSREFLVLIEADDADAELGRFRAAWRADDVRGVPQKVSVLRWRRHGHTYRAFGRPRAFQPLHREPPEPGRRYASATFRYRDAMAFVDEEETVGLGLVAGSLSAGATLPCPLPTTLGTVTGQRAGIVTVSGLAAVPFVATIEGPSSGAATGLVLRGPGWLLDFGTLILAPGQTLVVDTAGIGSALRDGISVAGALSRASTLTGRLSPGTAEFRFSASDPSATATAIISWRPAALVF